MILFDKLDSFIKKIANSISWGGSNISLTYGAARIITVDKKSQKQIPLKAKDFLIIKFLLSYCKICYPFAIQDHPKNNFVINNIYKYAEYNSSIFAKVRK